MAQMNVTPQMMTSIGGEIGKKLEEWEAATKKIYDLNTEMNAMWEGAANDAFNQAFAEDQKKFTTLANMMTEYQNAVVTVANSYLAGEENAKTLASRM